MIVNVDGPQSENKSIYICDRCATVFCGDKASLPAEWSMFIVQDNNPAILCELCTTDFKKIFMKERSEERQKNLTYLGFSSSFIEQELSWK